MIAIVGIDHIVLRTDRREQMLDFYVGVLGCTVERETSQDTGLTQLRAGNALIDLVTVDGELGRAGGDSIASENLNMDHFCLQIQPMAEADIIRHLQNHGIKTGDFSSRYGAQGQGNSLYIEDPQGNLVELRNQL